MTQTHEIIITNVLPNGGCAFAIRADNQESVFVPSHMRSMHSLEIGGRVKAILQANTGGKVEQTPWRVALIEGPRHATAGDANDILRQFESGEWIDAEDFDEAETAILERLERAGKVRRVSAWERI